MECLFIPPVGELTASTEVHWVHSEETKETRCLSLADCAAALHGHTATLVLPMEVASAFAVNLPTTRARWLRQALPYAVEELLAEDVEQLHLALGERLADGRHRIIVVRRSLLEGWLGLMAELGIRVSSIFVDADLLPYIDNRLLFIGDRVLLGGAGPERLVLAAEDWPALAERCSGPLRFKGEMAPAPEGIPPASYTHEPDPYRLLSRGRGHAVNLAQGDFAIQHEGAGPGPWKGAAVVVGAWLVLQFGFNVAQGWYLRQQGDDYAAASRKLYHELFPEDKRIVNLRAQFAERLQQGGGTGGGRFLQLLDRTADAFLEAPQLSIVQLDYSENDGNLALQVHAGDFAALERLRQRLADSGLAVQLGSASREEGGVSARLVVGS